MYKEVEGDLIALTKEGNFEVIAHGCNCFCTMGAGIALPMKYAFRCDAFDKEAPAYKGDINKLGTIDYRLVHYFPVIKEIKIGDEKMKSADFGGLYVTVINAYTQYHYGKNSPGCEIPLDYSALELCLRKINHNFKGKKVGLPQIGCGLAGGKWEIVKGIIQKELCDCDTTVVIFKK